MKKFKHIRNTENLRNTAGWILLLAISLPLIHSCQKEEEIFPDPGEAITLSVSDTFLTLSQSRSFESVFSLSWTRGTNHGTSSSISYILEMDKAGNDFTEAQIYDLGKGIYEKQFTTKILNDLMLNYWNILPGSVTSFEARVKANVIMEGVEDGISEIISFSLTPYEPVTEELFLIGSATPNGWDIENATPMISGSAEPWVFSYEGQMKSGSFKFAVNKNTDWAQDFYTKDPSDDTKMVFNRGGSGEDLQWELTEGGSYHISVNLLELSMNINKLAGPEFNELYIIGDACPSGWNIESPEAFTQSSTDPFIFTYETVLTPGDFKISTFTGDWCDGQWINPEIPDQELTANEYIVTNGCDGPDNKWHVTEETQGRYLITVDQYNSIITIEKVMVYLIGDGGPNGWNIGSPEPMAIENGIYVFEGELGADNPTGELKFSKYKGDWCDGDWIIATSPDQAITDTSHKIRHGCEGDDFKWRLREGDAGFYRITLDLESDVLTIEKQ